MGFLFPSPSQRRVLEEAGKQNNTPRNTITERQTKHFNLTSRLSENILKYRIAVPISFIVFLSGDHITTSFNL